MEWAKRLFPKLLRPSKWVLFFVPPLSFAALVFIFMAQNTRSAPAYLIYCMSAYSLTIWLAAIPRLTKRIGSAVADSRLMQKAASSKITGRYLNDPAFRSSIIYLSALYTFYAMTASVIHLVKFRRLGSPILSAAKVLNLIAAMMSLLGLQTAMISRFSENGERFRRMMNTITGGFIYGAVIVIAVYMLLHSRTMRREVPHSEPIGK